MQLIIAHDQINNNSNILIIHNLNIIQFLINKDSDLIMLFCLIKTFSNCTEFIPQSVYVLKNNEKIKKNLSKIKKIDMWEFLDIWQDGESYFSESGKNTQEVITGWELRFVLNIEHFDYQIKIEKSVKEHGETTNDLKKKTNDI